MIIIIEKIAIYLCLAREMKKLCNMRVKPIPILVSALGAVRHSLVKGDKLEISWRIKTIKTSALLKWARVLRRVLETSLQSSVKYQLQTLVWNNNNNNNNNNQQKKRTCKIVDFTLPADHRIKLKESKKKDKYLDLARELKKMWNMQVIIIAIVIGAFGTVTKGLLKGLEDLEVGGRVDTIQTTTLLRTARILRKVLETWGDLQSLRLQWMTIS